MEEWGNGRLKGYYYMAMKIQFHLLKIERVIFYFLFFVCEGLVALSCMNCELGSRILEKEMVEFL